MLFSLSRLLHSFSTLVWFFLWKVKVKVNLFQSGKIRFYYYADDNDSTRLRTVHTDELPFITKFFLILTTLCRITGIDGKDGSKELAVG